MKKLRGLRVLSLVFACVMIFSLLNQNTFASTKSSAPNEEVLQIQSLELEELDDLNETEKLAEDDEKDENKEVNETEDLDKRDLEKSESKEDKDKDDKKGQEEKNDKKSEDNLKLLEEDDDPIVVEESLDYYPASSSLNVGPVIESLQVGAMLLRSSGMMNVKSMAPYVDPQEHGLTLTKTATPTDGNKFRLDLTATTESDIVTTIKPSDIIMVLDRSGSMSDLLSYTPITSAPSTNSNYYVKVDGSFIQVSYSSNRWSYKPGILYRTRYVTWDINGDDNSAGNTSSSNPRPKPFYRRVTRLQGLKDAANAFVNKVYAESPDSRIAIVSYSGNVTNNTGGLVNVKSNNTVNNTITNAINGLNADGATHSNKGMGMAKDIFQADNSSDRNRVVIKFTDGEPGNYGFDNNDGSRYAAATINQAAVLKGARGTTLSSDVSFNNQRAGNGNIDGPKVVSNEVGCGATVYSVGVFDSNVNTLVHRYMAWMSSDNKTNATNSNGHDYYFTADSTESLDSIFQAIAEETGETVEDVVIKDYINPAFDIVDANGNILEIGDTITVSGETGTIMIDDKGIYVRWTKARIRPGTIAEGKGFKGSLFIKPKSDFIGGNNIPTNTLNISAIYTEGNNIGSFPNPLVNVPFNISVKNIQDYILLGESVPKSVEVVQEEIVNQNLHYNYPNGMLEYSWSPNLTSDTKPTTTTDFNLNITAEPINYISFNDQSIWEPISGGYKNKNTGEIYNLAVGTVAVGKADTGTYTIRPVKPEFAGSTYNIFLGETSGDGGASTLSNAITLSIPNKDIAGVDIPTNIKNNLQNRLSGYKNRLTFKVDAINPATAPSYIAPLSGYKPVEDTILKVKAKYDSTDVQNNIPVTINVKQGSLTITKAINGTVNPNQTFVFEIKQYDDTDKTTLIKTFYETIRVSSEQNNRTIIKLPKGYYEVSEKDDWSWKYNVVGNKMKFDTLGLNANGSRNINKINGETTLSNQSKVIKFLSSDDWVVNEFK
ncbi:vWA domain-containing protein [Alkalibaculum sporogenes]|nr:vWA domain-containing protein [Alkalibaculum sporogenes]